MKGRTHIIGVDCAAQYKNMGLALGYSQQGSCVITHAGPGGNEAAALALLREYLAAHDPVVIALDAPLGWPAAMALELSGHAAGYPIRSDANAMFMRLTDMFIWKCYAKKPLEVGANFIARTAHAALRLLAQVADGRDIPVKAVGLRRDDESCAIEVYPSVSLRGWGLFEPGYRNRKTKAGAAARAAIMTRLARLEDVLIQEQVDRGVIEHNVDVLDAVVCVLAAHDFITGNVIMPCPGYDRVIAKEGWTWGRPSAPGVRADADLLDDEYRRYMEEIEAALAKGDGA